MRRLSLTDLVMSGCSSAGRWAWRGYRAGQGQQGARQGGWQRRERGPLTSGPSRGEQNNYCQHFVDTGERPQNFLRDVQLVRAQPAA